MENLECTKCHESCATCNGKFDYCLSCKNALITPTNGSCLCADGQYFDSINQICQDCHENCLTCTGDGEEHCVYCKNPQFEMKRTAKRCGCSQGKYYDATTDECRGKRDIRRGDFRL